MVTHSTNRRPRRGILVFAGVGLLLVPLLGATFAASISLNSGGDIEFGQGQSGIAACDASIDIRPESSYDGSTFSLTSVFLDNVDLEETSGETDCLSTTFTVTLRGSSSTLDTIIFITGTSDSDAQVTEGDWTISTGTYSDNTGITLTRSGAVIDSSDLVRIALETTD